MIRYFHYISRRKVEEAFSQIPPGLFDRLSVELNSAFLPVSVSADGKQRAETIEAKLEVVEAALRAEGQVGTIAAPGPWFAGTVTMNWGFFGRDADGNPDVVFFIGTFGDILVALGGSAHNARRSGLPEEPRPYSNSGWATMMHALRDESQRIRGGEMLRPPTASEAARLMRLPPRQASVAGRDEAPTTRPIHVELWHPTLPGNADAWPAEAMEVHASFPGRGRDVEFIARFADQSDHLNDYPAILGSPLYVADAPGVKAVAEPDTPRRRFLPFRRSQ
jgi:hypothetical protein